MHLIDSHLKIHQIGLFHFIISAAGQFVQVIEERQGLKIACLEELGYRNGWITKEKLMKIVVSLGNTPYGNYVKMIAEQ